MDEKRETDDRVWSPTEREIRGSIYAMWVMMVIIVIITGFALPRGLIFMVPMASWVGLTSARQMRHQMEHPDSDEDD